MSGDVINNGSLRFGGTSTFSVAGDISGSGQLTLEATDPTVTLTGTNAYAGGTTILAGTLRIGNNTFTGSIIGNVSNNGTLIFSRRNAHLYAGAISGAGNVMKLGVGELTLTGAHSFTGTTTIAQGRLALSGNGSISSSQVIDVNLATTLDVAGVTGGLNFLSGDFALAADQTLTGNGMVSGDVRVRDDATLAPGGSPGTLTVEGNVTFSPGSTLAVELAGPTDSNADRSRLVLSGDLAFSGSLVGLNFFTVSVLADEAFAVSAPAAYTIASAGQISSNSLNSPLTVVAGASGTGSAINVSSIRLSISGFNEGDELSLQRSGNDLMLSFIPTILPGDYNEDGVVNAADYVVWRNNEGTMNPLANDPLGGTIGDAQYEQWRDNFGNTSGGGSAIPHSGFRTPHSTAVPEPASALCIIAAMGALIALRVKLRARACGAPSN
jgi:autotransporter-associated beta strand protein